MSTLILNGSDEGPSVDILMGVVGNVFFVLRWCCSADYLIEASLRMQRCDAMCHGVYEFS